MTDYNLGRVVGTDGTGIQSIASILEASGRTKVVITLTTGTTETFYIEKGTKGDTGTGIRTIELISTVGKDKNYRITFTDNTTFDYTISDGEDAVCDTELDIDSENAVQNKVITGAINTINSALDLKYDKNDVLQLLYDYGHVSDGTVSRITLVSDKDILSYADGDVATLTATVYDSSDNGVANQRVVFYKDGKVLDTGVTDANGEATYEYESEGAGDITFGASAGRFVIETYSIQDYLYVPQLDGSETIHQVQGTTTITNNELSGGSGYLTTAFPNSNNWELSFDGKFNDGQCGFWIIKSDETQRDNNSIVIQRSTIYTYLNGTKSETTLGSTLDANYHHFKLTKNGNNFTLVIDDSITVNFTWSLATTLNDLCIGVDSWGGTTTIKNIVVKPL